MADIRDAQGVVIRKVPWYDKHRWGLYEGLLSFAVGIFIFAIVIFSWADKSLFDFNYPIKFEKFGISIL